MVTRPTLGVVLTGHIHIVGCSTHQGAPPPLYHQLPIVVHFAMVVCELWPDSRLTGQAARLTAPPPPAPILSMTDNTYKSYPLHVYKSTARKCLFFPIADHHELVVLSPVNLTSFPALNRFTDPSPPPLLGHELTLGPARVNQKGRRQPAA